MPLPHAIAKYRWAGCHASCSSGALRCIEAFQKRKEWKGGKEDKSLAHTHESERLKLMVFFSIDSTFSESLFQCLHCIAMRRKCVAFAFAFVLHIHRAPWDSCACECVGHIHSAPWDSCACGCVRNHQLPERLLSPLALHTLSSKTSYQGHSCQQINQSPFPTNLWNNLTFVVLHDVTCHSLPCRRSLRHVSFIAVSA